MYHTSRSGNRTLERFVNRKKNLNTFNGRHSLLKSNVISSRAGAITQQVHRSDYSLSEVERSQTATAHLPVATPRRKTVRKF